MFVEASERLRDAVLGECEVGLLETLDRVAVRIDDNDVEDDQAGSDVDGGDGLGVGCNCWGWLLGGQEGCGGQEREQKSDADWRHGGSGGRNFCWEDDT